MPDRARRNALEARLPLPEFYWTGATDMNCLWAVIAQTLEFGYAHHIQRLMVTGLPVHNDVLGLLAAPRTAARPELADDEAIEEPRSHECRPESLDLSSRVALPDEIPDVKRDHRISRPLNKPLPSR